MRTAIVSDLHLGTLSGSDVARHADARELLLRALDGADRVVILGDAVELREHTVAGALEATAPYLRELGSALAGRRLTLVAGNHDHGLAGPWLRRLELDDRRLDAAGEWPVERGDGALGRIAALMPEVEVGFAYPGLWLRDDVYATHGHYLDLHLTVPRLESIAASAMGRLTRRGSDLAGAAAYEAVLAPLYGFYGGLAQGALPGALARGSSVSRDVWEQATGDGRVARALVGRIGIPGAVAVLNRLGLGPFSGELTGVELRRAGLLAMGRVADVLAPAAEHVIFGHTHRPGPLDQDELPEWTTLAGTRLWNSGGWYHERAFVRPGDRGNPYWPGTVVTLEDEGPPALANALAGWTLPSE